MTDVAVRQLVEISSALGGDPDLVQGGGGNTSAKTPQGRYMYIKASGVTLKEMSPHKGWCKVTLAPIVAMLKDKAMGRLEPFERERVAAKRLADSRVGPTSRLPLPSTESYFHAILGAFTVHLHPLVVGAYVCSKNGRDVVERLFRDWRQPILWVPYAPTGYMLGKKLSGLARRYERSYGREPTVVFLQKHGLVVSADTAEAALQTVHKVIKVCKTALPPRRKARLVPFAQRSVDRGKQAVRRAVAEMTGLQTTVEFFRDSDIVYFLGRDDARALCRLRPLVPQEIGYAGGSPMWLEQCEDQTILEALRRYRIANGSVPAAFLVKDMGLFVAGSRETITATRDVTTVSLLTRIWTKQFGGPEPLTRSQQRFVTIMYPFRFKT